MKDDILLMEVTKLPMFLLRFPPASELLEEHLSAGQAGVSWTAQLTPRQVPP